MGRLAIDGAMPRFSSQELAKLWPIWGSEELGALERVLESGAWCRIKDVKWTDGEAGRFEEEFRRYIRSEYFLGVANGTVAIELALLAAGIQLGDEVLVPASTFFGTVTPVLRIGAIPAFVDIDPSTFLMDPGCLAARITRKSRAVIVVHLSGLPVDIDRILAICRENDLFLIEDCAQAVGSKWRDRHVGTFGHVGCFSFQQDKVLTAGEGGGVATQDPHMAGRLFARHQGFQVDGAPSQEKHEVSTNARITPWQAAILRCQLNRLEEQIECRVSNAKRLLSLLQPQDPLVPVHLSGPVTRWSLYNFPFRYVSERTGLSRDVFMDILREEGVPVHEGHSDPVYRRPLFLENRLLFRNDGCPEAESYASEGAVVISHRFFLGPELWMDKLVEVVREIQAEGPRLARSVPSVRG